MLLQQERDVFITNNGDPFIELKDLVFKVLKSTAQ